jgi:Ca2+/Na+ antiporter
MPLVLSMLISCVVGVDAPNDVGLGTIVGAALFNLFLVIGLWYEANI